MRRPFVLTGVLSLLLAVSVGCTDRGADGDPAGGAGSSTPLPEAAGLLRSAATELATVKTARFAITTQGAAESLGISGAEGVITATGEAQGSARIEQGGLPLELQFVVKDGTLHVNGLTGGWQKLPLSTAATIYDPTALLSPDRGIANLVSKSSGATEARETLDGVETYRIKGTLPGSALGSLVPGVSEDVTGTLWIGADRPLLHRALFPVPGQTGTVTVTFSEYDVPVTIRVP
ncbi:LppX_LprAFG lipoprotein [Plantactinospora sp. S1510]|uniref:LppX_LprAFG lipoprotein n=1 Tax=Plantactinospora alkalitolerans TaxID=2789879 RepID=A0ABS0GSB5_9ACTN|nr:LppX_LprAFG lipoprotein [Plantactinospora alkalitolerans]MBF9129073.1 LppX_LprAFG lipoprotein [Plantactinospora alkalitolerans]